MHPDIFVPAADSDISTARPFPAQPDATTTAGEHHQAPHVARSAPQLHAAIDALTAAVASMDATTHGFSYFDATAAHDQVAHINFQDPYQDLAGWIIPAKDLVDVTGMPTTFGSAARTRMATSTHPFVAKLQARGAIIPGKSATCEFGMTAYTEPVGLPAPHNPLFTYPRTPGGSSGGAAVMVAQGLVGAAHASDGGGSIRIPAACTGLVGLKPAHNPAGGNCIANGYLATDLPGLVQLQQIRPRIRPLRIGVLLHPLHAPLPQNWDEECFEVVEQAAAACARVGHEVKQLPQPYGPEVFAAFEQVMAKRATKIPGPASPLVCWLRESGQKLHTQEFERAIATMSTVRARLLHAWDVDIVLTPMLTFAPPALGYFESLDPAENFYHQTQWTPWGAMYNMSGSAALSLPWEAGQARITAGEYVPSIQLGGLRAGAASLCGLALQLAGVAPAAMREE
ncbi:MAG: amidase family protein [Corynebacterium sp.]|nr:amidase family protein [Corynebacterium sp.]